MELKPLFDSFYDKMVLRDLFGKAVPGVLFMMCAIGGLLGADTLGKIADHLNLASWIVAAGLAWLLGFALQYLGELSHLLRTHPRCNGRYVNRDAFYSTWAAFHELASPHEKVHAERLNVIKEACGNAAISLAFAAAFFAVGNRQRHVALNEAAPLIVVCLILFLSLWRMHVRHVERYGDFLYNTTEFHKHLSASHKSDQAHN
jgi:hypothetical protein